jgi:excisionase family DNA binding protein
MQEKLLDQWHRFKAETGDPLAAAILTLAAVIASDKGKTTGLTVLEAAEFLGIHETTVRGLCKAERLRCSRVGRAMRFTTADLEAFQRQKTPLPPVDDASNLRHFQRKKKQSC